MHRARTKKQELRRRLLTYTIAPIVIGVGVSVLVMYIIGYRYNSTDQTVDQGGLVQFATKPTGAQVEVDGAKLRRATNTRLDASSGTHTVTMTKAGYRPWQKTVSVEPGSILWLDYVRLIPETVKTTEVLNLKSAEQTVSLYEKDTMLIMENKNQPVINVVSFLPEPTIKKVELPRELVKNLPTSSYSIDSVDGSGRYVIMKTSGAQTNWFFVDLSEPSRSLNISTIATADMANVQFHGNDARKLYVLSKDTLRSVDLSERTTSAPLISKVDTISVSPKGVVSYVSKLDDKTGQRVVGYYTSGASKPRIIKRIYDDGKQPVEFKIDHYRDDRYGVVRVGNNLDILSLRAESSDAPDDPRIENLSTITLPEGSDYLSFSPKGRFILSQKASTFTTYDLELMKVTTSSLKGDTSVNRQLLWLDEHHIWSDRGGKLTMYEFDGENAQILTKVKPGTAALLSKNGKHLWYIDSSKRDLAIKSAELTD